MRLVGRCQILGIALIASISACGNSVFGEEVSADNSQIDFTAYDCQADGDFETKHVGQYLGGSYQEWVETYSMEEGNRQIHCITLLVPDVEKLSAGAAQTHKALSANTGVMQRARSQSMSEAMGRIVEAEEIVPAIPLGLVDAGARDQIKGAISQLRSNLQSIHAPGDIHRISKFHQTPLVGKEAVAQSIIDETKDRQPAQSTPRPASPPKGVANKDNLSQTDYVIQKRQWEGQSVDETDDRTRVVNGSSFPWNTISILYIGFPSGAEGQCTGTLVSPYVILTAGHCVHARDEGGYLNRASAAPGQTQSTFFGSIAQPFGERSARYVTTTERWKNLSGGTTRPIRDYVYDYAALFFDEPWTHTDTFMPIVYSDTRQPVNSAGYPGTVQGVPANLGMWQHFGPETQDSISFWRNLQLREFAIDSSGGNSGGPFWLFSQSAGTRELTGILSYGATGEQITGGPWLGGGNESTVAAWINWTPEDEAPQPDRQGLRLTGLSSAEFTSFRSFLRFYNAGANSGAVTVSVSRSSTGELLGTWTSDQIPTHASRQFELSQIEQESNPPITPSNSLYAIAIEADFDGYIQHVAWNDQGASLTNLTGCNIGISNDVSTLINFHSSNLSSGYESVMYFHNVGSETAEATIWIYDSVTGDYIGGFVWDEVAPDASISMDSDGVDYFLNEFYDHVPGENQNHYNIVLAGDFPGYIQHVVDNAGAGVVTNMAAKCDLRASED